MKNENHDKYYSEKSVLGLIKLIVEHRTNINPLGDEWYNALIEHVNKRDISESVTVLVKSAINDDLESLNENITIQNILIKSAEELNIPQVEIQQNRKPLTNLNIENAAKNGEDSILLVRKDEIIKAGNSIKRIGLLIIVQFLITVILLFLIVNQKDFEVIKNYYGLFAIISFFIALLIVLQFIIAGDALKDSVKNNNK